MDLLPGANVGRYEILSFIGAGGMGQVYRAHDAQLGRDVAIKILPSNFVGKSVVVARFQQEAKALGALNHPNLVSVYDFGTVEDSFYIVLELLDGETLRARLRDGAIPVRRAVQYATQIARGMSAAHDRGIIHRDLKPENVFLCSDGRLKILDFGLARIAPQLDALGAGDDSPTAVGMTQPGALMGTVGYVAPEQLRAEPADERSDIFAFGVILYEMVTGRKPFHGATSAETLTKLLRDDPDDFRSLGVTAPTGIELIVRRCIEKRREDRFQTAHDLALALEAVSGSTDTYSLPIAFWKMRARRLRPVAILTAAILATALLGAFVWQSVRRDELPSYRQLTFRRGDVSGARFAPDGTIVYSASWEGRGYELYTARADSVDSRPLGIRCRELLAMSGTGTMAMLTNERDQAGTLAVVGLAGSAPREVVDNVQEADWSPDGQQLAVARRLAGTYRIEYPIGTTIYESPTRVRGVRVSPDGKHVAFYLRQARLGKDFTLLAVDREKNVRELGRWSTAKGLAWAPDSKRVLIASGKGLGSTDLYSVTLSGDSRLVTRFDGSVRLHDVSARGELLLTRDDYREGIMARGAGAQRESDLSWFDGSGTSDISPDGRMLLMSEFGEAGGTSYSIYVRPTNGDPAVRLGDGYGVSLSPDGKSALAIVPGRPPRLAIVPLGAGATRTLERGEVEDYEYATWLPDQRTIVFNGRGANGRMRLYKQDVERGAPQPLSDERFRLAQPSRPVSPDGASIFVRSDDRSIWIVRVDGREPPRRVPLEVAVHPVSWSTDGRALIVYEEDRMPARMYRFDLETKELRLMRELMPADPAGVYRIMDVVATPDGDAYAYGALRNLSMLFTASGVL